MLLRLVILWLVVMVVMIGLVIIVVVVVRVMIGMLGEDIVIAFEPFGEGDGGGRLQDLMRGVRESIVLVVGLGRLFIRHGLGGVAVGGGASCRESGGPREAPDRPSCSPGGWLHGLRETRLPRDGPFAELVAPLPIQLTPPLGWPIGQAGCDGDVLRMRGRRR